MFRKLVSNLPFSPALVGQLGFYAKRLRKEEATRKAALVVTALALVVQSLAVFNPPEAANAETPGQVGNANRCTVTAVGARGQAFTVVNGGSAATVNFSVTGGPKCKVRISVNSYRAPSMDGTPYEKQTLFDHQTNVYGPGSYAAGVNLPTQSTPAKGCYYQVDLTYGGGGNVTPVLAYGHGAVNCGGGGTTITTPPPAPPTPTPSVACTGLTAQKLSDTSTNYSITGSAAANNGGNVTGYTFTVYRDNQEVKSNHISTNTMSASWTYDASTPGSYVVKVTINSSLGDINNPNCAAPFTTAPPKKCDYNPSLPPSSPDCQPCPGDENIWIKDSDCKSKIIYTKTATNMTRGNVNATTVTARASDRIAYTLSAKNIGKAPADASISDDLSDTLEYATLVDSGGGSFDKRTKEITWPTVTLSKDQETSRVITVQVLKKIPATNTGTTQKQSYDCKMTNTVGNTTNVKVKCPVEKVVVEQTVSQLPHTGPGENLLFAGIVLAVVVYFYARTRQLGKEVRLIRRNVNAGAI